MCFQETRSTKSGCDDITVLNTVCLGSRNIFFCIFIFYVSSGVELKGMVESSLLSEDEPLNRDIDGVMAL